MSDTAASFYRRAEDALGDAALRDKVRQATGRLLQGREAGFRSFLLADAVRDRARLVRADVIAHLDLVFSELEDGDGEDKNARAWTDIGGGG